MDGRRRRTPPAVRFWAKVNKDGPIHPSLGTPCWLWTGAVVDVGYGNFGAGDGRTVHAHRFSWELTHGPIPSGPGHHGTCVLHRCDNRLCVNTEHLFLGSQRRNMHDMLAKGREQRGEKHAHAVLTADQVREIRARVAAGEPRMAVGAAFGISHKHVHKIVHRELWAHIA